MTREVWLKEDLAQILASVEQSARTPIHLSGLFSDRTDPDTIQPMLDIYLLGVRAALQGVALALGITQPTDEPHATAFYREISGYARRDLQRNPECYRCGHCGRCRAARLR